MKHLKKFNIASEFDAFKSGEDYILPNVSYIVETNGVSFNPCVPPPSAAVGDVAYWDGSKVKTCALDSYNESMGTAVGVVVIPGNFLPDGKARMIALKLYEECRGWGGAYESGLDYYNGVPITDNAGSTTDSNWRGYLPSDIFTGTQSFVDPLAKYSQNSMLIPSPYLSDGTLNPEYMKTIDGCNNVLSDFDGKGNTDVLVNSSIVARVAKGYVNSVGSIDWYLPSCGELGVMLARLGKIETVILSLGGDSVFKDTCWWWSSNEYSTDKAYAVGIRNGDIVYDVKHTDINTRSFAMID